MILVTELGDKTFFIAAIMAMKNSRILVFQGALCALLCMTLLSVALGKTFPLLFSKKYTSLAAGVLFAYFGIQLLRDWWISRSNNTSNVDDELNELEEQITTGSYHSESSESRLHMSLSSDSIGSRNKYARSNSSSASNGQLHHNTTAPTFYPFVSHVALQLFSPVFVRSFSLTFLAEWGDRSQVATVALSASKDMYGVCIGAIAGHFVCTGLAVLGGRLLASRISERTVGFIGGILFLVFSVLSFSGQLE
ncbi:GDT1-like protein 3 [Galdieria sulphuraria]|nr:GDT1-like protein 3 [Galdieria sulphuraria]